METLSLIVGVIGGALGAFSILVTWKLYQAANQVNLDAIKVLGEIKSSSHTAEVTSTRYTERLVGGLMELVSRDVQASLTAGRATLVERIDEALAKELRGADQVLASRLREKVHAELASTFRAIKSQTATIPRLSDAEIVQGPPASTPKVVVAPGVPRLLKWIVDNERRYRFYSVKFLREKLFASDPVAQEALQFAIDEGILETYELPNPNNPSWPVTACRLNRNHPVACEILPDGRKEPGRETS